MKADQRGDTQGPVDEEYTRKMDNILDDFMNKEPELREQWEKLSESCKKAGK